MTIEKKPGDASPRTGICVAVTHRSNNNRKAYICLLPCDAEKYFVSQLCKCLSVLSKHVPRLASLREKISEIHEYSNRCLAQSDGLFNYGQEIVLRDWFGDFFVRADRCLLDETGNLHKGDCYIQLREIDRVSNWGAELRTMANRLRSIVDLSFFDLLQSYGSTVDLSDNTVINGEIRGRDDFLVPAAVLYALSYEGFMNFVGEQLFDDWKETEKQLKTIDKQTRILEHLGIEFDLAQRPWVTVVQLFEIRNEFAHPKFDRRKLLTESVGVGELTADREPFSEAVTRLDEEKDRIYSAIECISSDTDSILELIWESAAKSIEALPPWFTQDNETGNTTTIRNPELSRYADEFELIFPRE